LQRLFTKAFFMQQEKYVMFSNRLTKVSRHLSKQAKRQHITCYRIYDHDLPEFPFCIDRYENKLSVAEYKRKFEMAKAEHEKWLNECLGIMSLVLQVPEEDIYIRERQRKTSRLDQYGKIGEEKEYFIANEGGLKFKVNLSDYLDTGLFTDHRITRQMVKEQSKGKKVLNLFCYTGSFSVYAAAGGANETVSIDLSNTYLDWAKDNLQLNNLYDPAMHHFIKADVLQYLPKLPAAYFDLAILDPPTFSNSKMMKDFLDIQRDHVQLINDTLRTLVKEGVLYFSTNYTKFVLDEEKIKASVIKDITKATTPFDFEGKLKRYCFRIIK
jgi:23S rRNA (cytosine1962-C5)-methyltransferase